MLVCPTSTSTRSASVHAEVAIGDELTCVMVGAVDSRMLGWHVAHPALDEMRRVDDALELVLDL